jgi:3-phosphoshikimate 1-carboxyvinyltransferase
MKERPIKNLVSALKELGAEIEYWKTKGFLL